VTSFNVRGAVFWGLDYFSGSPFRRHLNNIRLISQNENLIPEHQARQLQLLLCHAVQTTDFYNNRSVNEAITGFPIINKNIIRESFAQFQSSVFKNKKLKVMQTSGSTGTPFQVVQNSSKRQRALAELIEFNSLVGYRVGTRHALFRTLFRTIDPRLHKNSVKRFMQNEIEFDVRIQDQASFEQQRQTLLKDKHIEILTGYSSVIYNLARYIISQRDTPTAFGVKGVLCFAEPLFPKMRDTIQNVFNCPVLSRYSNQECGVLAYECPTCNRFHLNTASYFFEILELDRDKQTTPGTSGRIVVTDLYNYAMPMIRYDTGDIGSMGRSNCSQFATPILQSLEGRKLDCVYDTAGRWMRHLRQ